MFVLSFFQPLPPLISASVPVACTSSLGASVRTPVAAASVSTPVLPDISSASTSSVFGASAAKYVSQHMYEPDYLIKYRSDLQ